MHKFVCFLFDFSFYNEVVIASLTFSHLVNCQIQNFSA